MLAELFKFIEARSFPLILDVVLSNRNGVVDNLHDELGVIFILWLWHMLAWGKLDVVFDFDLAVENQIIADLTQPVDLPDGFPHFGSDSGYRSWRVHICSVDENVMDDIVDLHDEVQFQFLYLLLILSEYIFDAVILHDRLYNLSMDTVYIEHYIFSCHLLCLIVFQLIFA